MKHVLHRVRILVKSLLARAGLDVRRRHDWDNPSLESVPGGLRKIHYGCGPRLFPGWLNVDLYPPPSTASARTLRVNLVRKHPFPDDWFELGYTEDFLEHLEQGDQIVFLAESCRTLQPKGVLRLYFPGLEAVLAHHYTPCTTDRVIKARAECYDLHQHRSFPSRADIELMARHVGFSEIRFVESERSTNPSLVGLEHRTDQAHVHLAVELSK